MVEIVVLNGKYRQASVWKKSKNYSSVANGSHPSIDQGGGKQRPVIRCPNE
jgi:hypothetical protein